MAKKNKKGARQSPLLPKRLAGVKIPKPLRRQAHHIAELARHPLVADIVAAGLVALAGTLRETRKGNPAKDAPAPLPQPEEPTATAAPAKPGTPRARATPAATAARTRKAPAPKTAH